jgi:hypothetical protein
MANLAVQIFTFTGTETAAVDELITGMTAVLPGEQAAAMP